MEGGQAVPGGAGLLTVDRQGQAVACAFTMNGPFGTGRMAPGLGMMIAAPPPAPDQSRLPLAALLAWNPYVKEFHFAAVAGGTGAETAVGTVAAQTLKQDMPLKDTVEAIGRWASGHHRPDLCRMVPQGCAIERCALPHRHRPARKRLRA